MGLEVTKELNEHLEWLAEAIGGTKADVLRKGIALLVLATEAKKENQTLCLYNKDTGKVVTRIVGV